MCQSNRVPTTTASTKVNRHQRAGRNRRARRPSIPSRRCRATRETNVASAHTIIARSLSTVGVDVNRESSSARTDNRSVESSPSGSKEPEGPVRSLKTPTICGRSSPSSSIATGGSAPTISAAVRSEFDATVTAVHGSSSGAETSTELRRTASTVPGAPSSPGTARITRPSAVASGEPDGMVETRVPPSEPSCDAAAHGTLTRSVSGA